MNCSATRYARSLLKVIIGLFYQIPGAAHSSYVLEVQVGVKLGSESKCIPVERADI